jgi:hypothetical protein
MFYWRFNKHFFFVSVLSVISIVLLLVISYQNCFVYLLEKFREKKYVGSHLPSYSLS